jgi:hypothetical protein
LRTKKAGLLIRMRSWVPDRLPATPISLIAMPRPSPAASAVGVLDPLENRTQAA